MERDMEYYIRISSQVILSNIDRREDLTKELCDRYIDSGKKEICIIASGSSLNAAIAAKSFMRKYLGRVTVMSPTEYIDYRKAEVKESFLILVSQSGCSTNIIEAAKDMNQDRLSFSALTGNADGDLKNYVADLIEYGVGNETVDYVTLGMVTLIEYLMLFTLQAAKERDAITKEEYGKVIQDMKLCCEAGRNYLEQAVRFTDVFYDAFLRMEKAIIVTDGPNMGIAREASLKFGETLKIPTVYYESEEYVHGPNMQLTPEYFVFFIDTNKRNSRIQEVFRATALVTEHTYLVTNKDVPDGENVIKHVNDIMNELTPLFTAVPFQYIAAHVTKEKNGFKCHPLFDKFEEMIHCKTADYDEVMKAKLLQVKEEEI